MPGALALGSAWAAAVPSAERRPPLSGNPIVDVTGEQCRPRVRFQPWEIKEIRLVPALTEQPC